LAQRLISLLQFSEIDGCNLLIYEAVRPDVIPTKYFPGEGDALSEPSFQGAVDKRLGGNYCYSPVGRVSDIPDVHIESVAEQKSSEFFDFAFGAPSSD
jgi:hypothetical protein